MTALDRSDFPVTHRYAYLNHAAVAVFPRQTRDALAEFVQAQADGGVMGVWRYEMRVPEFRETVARYIGAGAHEIAFLRNTTDGATIVAHGVDWQPGDELILCDNEFPANAYPWLKLRERGVNVNVVKTARERLTPEVLAREMSAKTKAVAVSWVSFADGYRHDLAALAEVTHARDALFCVDGIQGLGAFEIDVRACGIDVFFSGAQKWLLALQGISFVYVREALFDRIGVGLPGWRGVHDMWDFLNYDQPPAPDATRYEGGTPNFIGTLSLATSVGVLQRAGRGETARHVLALTDRLVEGLRALDVNVLSQRGDDVSSGIVLFDVPGRDSVALGKAIQERGIITTWRPNGIRVSPHGYNTTDEIDALLAAVKELRAAR